MERIKQAMFNIRKAVYQSEIDEHISMKTGDRIVAVLRKIEEELVRESR